MFEPLSAEYWEPVQRNRGYRQAGGIFRYGGHLGGGGTASAKGSLTLCVPETQSLSAQQAAKPQEGIHETPVRREGFHTVRRKR